MPVNPTTGIFVSVALEQHLIQFLTFVERDHQKGDTININKRELINLEVKTVTQIPGIPCGPIATSSRCPTQETPRPARHSYV